LSFDTANAPAEHAEAVDHRRVRVRAHTRVRVRLERAADLIRHDTAGEVLKVDLVDDAGARGHHLEVVEGGLAPAQELVALAVALVLERGVALKSVGAAEDINDNG